MAFSEQLKSTVKRKAHFQCCLCHGLYVEIHHILPQSEGGPDTESNAAPLCPSCHETYGANPDKRKFIQEARDLWFDLCRKRYVTDEGMLSEALKNVATKEDLKQLEIRNYSLVLGSSSSEGIIGLKHLRYSFSREEYIHPRILQELRGWLSDSGSSVVGVDIELANRSNRFYGGVSISNREGRIWVNWTGENERFGYTFIGSSPSGINMVECYEWTGGTGVFCSILLLAFNQDLCWDPSTSEKLMTRERIMMKVLGTLNLGDRYSGKVVYENGFLAVGPDEGWFERGEKACQRIPIR